MGAVVPLTDLARPADTQADAAAADADAGPRRGRLQEVAAR